MEEFFTIVPKAGTHSEATIQPSVDSQYSKQDCFSNKWSSIIDPNSKVYQQVKTTSVDHLPYRPSGSIFETEHTPSFISEDFIKSQSEWLKFPHIKSQTSIKQPTNSDNQLSSELEALLRQSLAPNPSIPYRQSDFQKSDVWLPFTSHTQVTNPKNGQNLLNSMFAPVNLQPKKVPIYPKFTGFKQVENQAQGLGSPTAYKFESISKEKFKPKENLFEPIQFLQERFPSPWKNQGKEILSHKAWEYPTSDKLLGSKIHKSMMAMPFDHFILKNPKTNLLGPSESLIPEVGPSTSSGVQNKLRGFLPGDSSQAQPEADSFANRLPDLDSLGGFKFRQKISSAGKFNAYMQQSHKISSQPIPKAIHDVGSNQKQLDLEVEREYLNSNELTELQQRELKRKRLFSAQKKTKDAYKKERIKIIKDEDRMLFSTILLRLDKNGYDRKKWLVDFDSETWEKGNRYQQANVHGISLTVARNELKIFGFDTLIDDFVNHLKNRVPDEDIKIPFDRLEALIYLFLQRLLLFYNLTNSGEQKLNITTEDFLNKEWETLKEFWEIFYSSKGSEIPKFKNNTSKSEMRRISGLYRLVNGQIENKKNKISYLIYHVIEGLFVDWSTRMIDTNSNVFSKKYIKSAAFELSKDYNIISFHEILTKDDNFIPIL
ncbi:expressed protein [Phakopsora pachyrhizi]|uniref:Expressed protein n=1 Tax=Phakopsora pachyrhizi TaxID=170000 RepID=A0AAV0AYD7_PHAPC|nr:expressed protein [Phakopsora pachyrhizi]